VKLLDVNVLIYAFEPSYPRHAEWRRWLDEARVRPFCVPDEVALGFLRIVTNRKVFATPATAAEGLAFLAALRGSPGWRESARPASRWASLARLCEHVDARGVTIPDAWLATLAIEMGAVLVSADRGFAAYPGVRVENPVG
jgi:hypothetical protein